MRRILERAALAAWLIACPGCHSDGVVGDVDACDRECGADEICDPMLGACVACDDEDCEVEAPDECDDCAASDEACIAMFCQSCTIDADCTGEESRCSRGVCVELEDL